ncbi:5-keto-4-deoxy-D-glucarate aldolase [Polystyrenella longa]|uniref:5-keto-4-deoxy-D-glucarate aldolase n=1 Tax=Polystyrenella longa TaxID=2528007 RepID=A0A518CN90_9PLAN|nr:aldolase/citrate lyase family protein [Polystyrenella longa]QDU80687.1 5-keto-4-deoxy-D-glucarate aldolase [Polystyrenella longa]
MHNIKARLLNDEMVVALGVGRVPHHNLIQMVGINKGFHAVWLDHEHAGMSMENLEVMTLAARSQGLDCFVRIAPTDYALVTKCLEAGGGGVMAAQIHTAEQAEEFVKWTKFYPRGYRGLNTSGWDGQFATIPMAEFCEKANRENFLAIQIETAQSVEEVDEIAAIEGVDLLFVGPADLSQNLGVTGDLFHEKCIDALDRVAAACKKHGKHWGAVTVSPEHAELLVKKGCRLISPASDTKLINLGIQTVKDQYKSYF